MDKNRYFQIRTGKC